MDSIAKVLGINGRSASAASRLGKSTSQCRSPLCDAGTEEPHTLLVYWNVMAGVCAIGEALARDTLFYAQVYGVLVRESRLLNIYDIGTAAAQKLGQTSA